VFADENGQRVQLDASGFTDVAKSVLSRGLLAEKPTLTIIPQGKPAAGAQATVREFSITEM
jgi:hypothetical protein